MSGNWTGCASGAPRRAGRRSARGAAVASLLPLLVFALLCASCGKTRTKNVIRPVIASLTLTTPYTGSPDPAIYMETLPRTSKDPSDLVLVNLKMRASGSPVVFDAFNLEIDYDPSVVQFGRLVYPSSSSPPSPFCRCDPADTVCYDPNNPPMPPPVKPLACLTNGDTTDQTGQFVLGISADVSGGQTYSVSGDVTLITFGFIAVAPTTGSSIKLIPGHGACEILMDLVEVPVPCLDGGAVITATR